MVLADTPRISAGCLLIYFPYSNLCCFPRSNPYLLNFDSNSESELENVPTVPLGTRKIGTELKIEERFGEFAKLDDWN